MKLEAGMSLYLYTARNGKFNVYEGVITENKRRYWLRLVVKFNGRSGVEYLPKEDEIGRTITGGPKLWLTERDDALARRLFLKYEEGKLEEMEKAVANKKELIRVLREGMDAEANV